MFRSRTWLWILSGLLLSLAIPWLPADQGYLQQQAQTRVIQEKWQEWVHMIRFFQHIRSLASLGVDTSAFLSMEQPQPQPAATQPSSSQRVPRPSPQFVEQQIWSWLETQATAPVQIRCQPSPCFPMIQRLFDRKSWTGQDLPAQANSPSPSQTTPSPPTDRKKTTKTSAPTDPSTSLVFRWDWTMRSLTSRQEQVSGRFVVSSPMFSHPIVLSEVSGQATKVHWYAIIPPLVAIYLVLLTRQVLLGLFFSLFLGVTLLHQANPLLGLYHTGWTYLWNKALYQEFSVSIILFVLSLVGMINVCTRNGGISGLLHGLLRYAKTARSSRLITACLGLVIFFDDYANTITVGNTMRPLTDRFRVSREKLAYLVDTTAAPIAGLAIVSTWIGYEVGLLQDLASHLSLPWGGYQIFLQSLPYRFYCWMTLLFMFLGIWMNRDFGPMLAAELRAAEQGKLLREGAQPMVDLQLEKVAPADDIPHRGYNALIPVGCVLFGVVAGLLYSGGYFHGATLQTALSQANGAKVFLYASLLGSFVAIGLSVSQRLLTWRESVATWFLSANSLWFAVGILLFAWSMGALSQDLGTAHYLIAMLHNSLPAAWIPLLIFLMASVVAFATGTSWATMSILLPTAVPLAFTIGGYPLLFLSVGAVLDGAIFGDHCSPLSDTTLFSSAASSCDHVDHVKTQAPYALTVMFVAAGCGYLAVAYGMSPYLSPLLALGCFSLIFWIVGRPLPAYAPLSTTDSSSMIPQVSRNTHV